MDFKGKVVMITGGVGGFGRAFTRAFLDKGSKVGICDIVVDEGNKLQQALEKEFGPGKVIFCKCDVTKDEDFEGAYNECEKRLGTVDILINNAGFAMEQDLKKMMAVNFGGVVRGSELALKKMGKHKGGKGGHIINIASIVGLMPVYFCPFYCASKAAVLQYTRCIGDEFHYNYSGVRCSSLCPDAADTPILRKRENFAYTPDCMQELDNLLETVPLLTPEEVTVGLFQLLNDNAKGTAIVVQKGKKPFYVPPSLTRD